MDRFASSVRRRLAVVMTAALASHAAGADIGGFVPTTPAEANRRAPAGWPANAAAHSAASQPPRAFPHPGRAVATSAEQMPKPLATAARPVNAKGPLPLSPPSPETTADEWSKQLTPLQTGAASLGIVVGLFLLVVLIARRGGPKSTSPLPYEAVEVLGRAPLVGRQHVHLVRCGNKLLLVCFYPNGAQTLTEITDPAEVDRLVGVCYGRTANGSPFRQLFGRLGGSRRRAGDYDDEYDAAVDFAHLDDMHPASHE